MLPKSQVIENMFLEHFRYWELYEAVFILTGCGDSSIRLQGCVPGEMCKVVGRAGYYDLKDKTGVESQSLLGGMKKAIKKHEFNSVYRFKVPLRSVDPVYFLSRAEVIEWVLFNDYLLPEIIQDKIRVRQLNCLSRSEPLQNSIRNQLVGQMIHHHFSALSFDEVLEHHLMGKYGSPTADKTRREARRDLKAVFGIISGKKGGKTYITRHLQPIQQVVCRGEAVSQYSFKSLRTVLTLTINILIEIIGWDAVQDMTIEELFERFTDDPVVRLYLDEKNEFVKNEIKKTFQRTIEQYFPLCTDQSQGKDKPTIGELREEYEEYCLNEWKDR